MPYPRFSIPRSASSFLPFKGRNKVGMGLVIPASPILTPALSLKEREIIYIPQSAILIHAPALLP
jgi:hypothetical protein